MSSNNSEKKQQARNLYLHTELYQTEIADILNIDRKTLYWWIRNNNWDKMKLAARQAPGVILQDIYNHIDAINTAIFSRDDRMPTPREVEMLRKLMNMTKNIERQHTGAYMQAFQELCTYVKHRDLDFAKKLTEYADKYVHGTLIHKTFTTEMYNEAMEGIKEEEERVRCETDAEVNGNASPLIIDTTPPAVDGGNNGESKKESSTPPEAPPVKPQSKNDDKSGTGEFPTPPSPPNGETPPTQDTDDELDLRDPSQ